MTDNPYESPSSRVDDPVPKTGDRITCQIARVSPPQAAKVMGIVYFGVSVPIVIFLVVAQSAAGNAEAGGFLLLFVPFIYAVLGFVFTLFGAWLYNGVARWVGGIEFTTVRVE
ncbi:MAG: hypothetical protein HY049_01275 [Acidobacteria bacterium]|nr:hypothetical protein [Acidobacteriota bacterium]